MFFSENVRKAALPLINLALDEDNVKNDATGIAAFNNNETCSVNVVAREKMTLAGMPIIPLVFNKIDENISVNLLRNDGETVGEAEILAVVSGPAVSVLAGERTMLNFLQRLSGIATITKEYVDAAKDSNVDIIDTRKTTPGWRVLEKYAVKCGGGVNHRFNLADMIMFKDNHIALSGKSISELILSAKSSFPNLKIACEADTLEQVKILLNCDVDIIMLDNMSVEMIKRAVVLNNGKSILEATGGITLNNIRDVANTGVNRISVGAITHSVKAVDIGMDVDYEQIKLENI